MKKKENTCSPRLYVGRLMMIRKSLRTWVALLLSCAAGCSALQDCVVDKEIAIRNHCLAQSAWGEWSWCYDDLNEPFHFACGFKAGYRNILEGGNGCQPTLPPKCYWKPKYQSPDGRCKINAWFDGYSHGALAAQQDGYGSLQEIPMSPTARMNLESRFAPPQQNPYVNAHGSPGPVPDAYLKMNGGQPHSGGVDEAMLHGTLNAVPAPGAGDGVAMPPEAPIVQPPAPHPGDVVPHQAYE
jgi:hypothetical protein